MSDCILLRDLEVRTRIGVPEEERAQPQDLILQVRIFPRGGFGVRDEIESTIDYAVVAEVLQQEAEARPRQLIERLGQDLIEVLFVRFPIERIWLRVEKKILPNTRWVGVELERARD